MLNKYQDRDVRVVHILPSEGWNAVFILRTKALTDDPMTSVPIICWALVQPDMGHPSVVGVSMDDSGEAKFVDRQDPNFLGLLPPKGNIDKYRKPAHDLLVSREAEMEKQVEGRRRG